MKTAASFLLVPFLLAASVPAPCEEPRFGMPMDWSHRVIIHHPETGDEAMARGAYGEWLAKARDPRYMAQLLRRLDADAATMPAGPAAKFLALPKPPHKVTVSVHRDWSNVMGGASGVGFAGTFPAKYGWDVNVAPSCVNDFVVYPTASAGATGSGNLALNYGTWSTNNGSGKITITNGTRVLTLTSSTTVNTGLFFQVANGTSTATRAANLAAAINRNGGTVGVTGGYQDPFVGYQAITAGTGGNSIGATENLGNFTWNAANASGGSGTAGQPTIFALNQLYASCGGSGTQPIPATYWSYNTGTGNFVELSPVLSFDGSQVAFVERSGTAASLVLLKWSATASVGTIGAPTVPATATAATYRACAAPCMVKFPLGANDVTSSPFVRYDNDELYVGDAAGKLHKFSGVFLGTPAEVGGSWPAAVSAGNALSSPVYDGATDLVFVGSARGASTGGQLHSVSSGGTVVSSGQLGGNPGGAAATGVADTPILDSLGQRVYAFVASDTSTSCGGSNCMAVYQFQTNASLNGLTAPRAQVGQGNQAAYTLRAGSFDNAYWSSPTSTSPSGFLYVCGAQPTFATRPTLWRIPITGNVMGTPASGPRLTNNTGSGPCSPPMEISDGTNDYLFTSVSANGNRSGCSGACIYMYDITSIAAGSWRTGLQANAGLAAPGGTGGIIFDNISTVAGASQVYYSTLTSPGNAIQASQAALQ